MKRSEGNMADICFVTRPGVLFFIGRRDKKWKQSNVIDNSGCHTVTKYTDNLIVFPLIQKKKKTKNTHEFLGPESIVTEVHLRNIGCFRRQEI